MKRLNLVKYGFVRELGEDFSDDGNRFTCYRVGKKAVVSKLVSNGEVFLSCCSACGNGTLPYETYSKLPHYKEASWTYNGVSLETLTDDDLQNFYEACIAYEQEYEAAEAGILYPTVEQLTKKAFDIVEALKKDLADIQALFGMYAVEVATRFSSHEWQMCQDYLKHISNEIKRFDPSTFPQATYHTSYSFSFMKREPEESFWANSIKKTFARYCMSV